MHVSPQVGLFQMSLSKLTFWLILSLFFSGHSNPIFKIEFLINKGPRFKRWLSHPGSIFIFSWSSLNLIIGSQIYFWFHFHSLYDIQSLCTFSVKFHFLGKILSPETLRNGAKNFFTSPASLIPKAQLPIDRNNLIFLLFLFKCVS